MNWSYLGAILPQGIEIIDFYHACEHLKAAFDAAYGENSAKSKAQFEKYRHLLRDEGDGVEKVIRALAHLRDAHPRKKKLSTAFAATVTASRVQDAGTQWRNARGCVGARRRSCRSVPSTKASASSVAASGCKLPSSTYKRTVESPENVVLFPKRTVH